MAYKSPGGINVNRKANPEVVFGKHYAKTLWLEYAEHVKAKTSTTVIDPNYVA